MLIVLGAVTCAVAAWRGARAFHRAPRQATRDVGAVRPLEPPAVPEGRRIIAVVGIDRYPDWPRLDNAVSDAKGALALFRRYGFELPQRHDGSKVTPLLDRDATSDAIRALITEDLEQLGHADSLIVFFAGHGHTVPHQFPDGVVTTGYVIPVDGGPSGGGARRWLRVDTLLSDIARLPPRHILVILDACNSGIALQSLSSFVKLRSAPSPGRRDRRSRRVITSARDDQSARDNGPVQGHSVFTGCLIDGFETGDIAPRRTQVTGTEIGVYLERRVGEYTDEAQTPDCGAFEFDQRGDLVIELAQAAPPALAEVPAVAAGALGRRPALPIALLSVSAVGLAMLSVGIYRSSSERFVAVPPVPGTAPPDGGGPRLAAHDSIRRSNTLPPIDGSSALPTHEIRTPSACAPRPATIDFEHYPNGTPTCSNCPVTNEFACWGVTFSFESLVSNGTPRPRWCQLQGPTTNNPTNTPTHIVNGGSLTAVPAGFPNPPNPLAGYDDGTIIMTFSSAPTSVIFTAGVNNDIALTPKDMTASGVGSTPNVMVTSGRPYTQEVTASGVGSTPNVMVTPGTPYIPAGSTFRFRKDTITVSAAPNGSISSIRIRGGVLLIDDMKISP